MLDVDAKALSSRKKDRRTTPYNKNEVENKVLPDQFNVVLNNCASYVLKVFRGFAECPLGPLWKYAPTRCQPITGTMADLPDEAEQSRVIKIFLSGIPKVVQSFADLLVFVQQRDFTAFILSTAPHESHIKWNSTTYHAMVGLLFEGDESWGVTFGAYPSQGVTTGMCGMWSNDCKNNVTIVLGDQIVPCARSLVPRTMTVRTRVPGIAIKEQMISELQKLV